MLELVNQCEALANAPGLSLICTWIADDAARTASPLHPIAWYEALLQSAARLVKPKWRDLTDFPPDVSTMLLDAHQTTNRIYAANEVTDASESELNDIIARQFSRIAWTLAPYEVDFAAEELAERKIIRKLSRTDR